MITKYDGDLRKHLVSNCAYSQHHSGAQPTHLELKENKYSSCEGRQSPGQWFWLRVIEMNKARTRVVYLCFKVMNVMLFNMLDFILSTLELRFHFISYNPMNYHYRWYHCFTNEKTEIQRNKMTFLGPHS